MALHSITASTGTQDASRAVEEIRRQLQHPGLQAVLLFVSVDYDMERLAVELREAFSVPILGCTSAGHIGPTGYQHRGLQATGIYGSSISVRTELIHPLDQCQAAASALGQKIGPDPHRQNSRRFGVLLVDGLSRLEERLAAALHHCFPDMPLIGGSAGDDLSFHRLVPNPGLIIGCDCILRRLEFEQSGQIQQVSELLAQNRVIGFSTYGEQFNALHMNQTFTGLAIGAL